MASNPSMATARNKAEGPSETPFPRGRLVKRKAAKALLAARPRVPPERTRHTLRIPSSVQRMVRPGKKQPTRSHHLLEGLLPQGKHFIEVIPPFSKPSWQGYSWQKRCANSLFGRAAGRRLAKTEHSSLRE